MTGSYRGGIVGIMLGLLACVPALSQTGDTAADHAEPVVLRTVADSVVTDWKGDRAYEYANDPAYWRWRDYSSKAPASRGSSSSGGRQPGFLGSQGFEYFILFLFGGILVYAVVRIIVANRLQLFYRPPRRSMGIKSEEEGDLEDDLEGQLMHFMQTKNYRQAVRYLYLKALRQLNDRGMIRYHQEATNQEYWQQLSLTPLGAPFLDLTMIYEKVWYGEFPLGERLFTRLYQYFEEFYKSARA